MVTTDCILKESQKRARHYKSTMFLCLVAQSFLTLCDPMDCSRTFSSIHGIFQSRILEWVAVSYSRGSSWPRDPAHISCVSCIDWWLPYNCTASIIEKNRTKPKNWRKKESQHFLNELINLDFYSLVQSSNLYSNYCLCLLTSLFTGREWRIEVKWSEVAQSCPTLCDPMDCSLSGSSIHGIFQARMLEWISISFSRGPFHPRNRTQVSRIAGRRFTIWTARKPQSNFFF